MKKFDKIYLMTFLIIIGVCSIITGQHNIINFIGFKLDTFYISLLASVVGVLYVVMVRLDNKYSMILGVVFSLLYCILAITNKNYGDFSVNLYCACICLFGFFNWSKSKNNNEKLLTLNNKQRKHMVILTLVIYAVMLFVLSKLGTNNLYIDALITTFVIIANSLMSLRYKELWIAFNIVNSLHCILWSIRVFEGVHNALPVLIMFIAYLSNSLIATYSLNKSVDE